MHFLFCPILLSKSIFKNQSWLAWSEVSWSVLCWHWQAAQTFGHIQSCANLFLLWLGYGIDHYRNDKQIPSMKWLVWDWKKSCYQRVTKTWSQPLARANFLGQKCCYLSSVRRGNIKHISCSHFSTWFRWTSLPCALGSLQTAWLVETRVVGLSRGTRLIFSSCIKYFAHVPSTWWVETRVVGPRFTFSSCLSTSLS